MIYKVKNCNHFGTFLTLQEEKNLALRKQGLGVVLDSELPHLIGIDDDILSTGIMLYHLKEGRTTIGTNFATTEQDIGILVLLFSLDQQL